jgi:hypothetical protein
MAACANSRRSKPPARLSSDPPRPGTLRSLSLFAQFANHSNPARDEATFALEDSVVAIAKGSPNTAIRHRSGGHGLTCSSRPSTSPFGASAGDAGGPVHGGPDGPEGRGRTVSASDAGTPSRRDALVVLASFLGCCSGSPITPVAAQESPSSSGDGLLSTLQDRSRTGNLCAAFVPRCSIQLAAGVLLEKRPS